MSMTAEKTEKEENKYVNKMHRDKEIKKTRNSDFSICKASENAILYCLLITIIS